MKTLLSCLSIALLLAACQLPNQNKYRAGEIGVSRAVTFATVLSVREVPIIGENSNTGMLLGAGAGAGGGSYVGGGGKPWATAGGAVLGGVLGHLIEQEINDRTGLEYILRTDDGETKSIVQEKEEGDVLFKKGDRVMLQSCDASDHYRRCKPGSDYQRLLPTDVPAPQITPSPKKKKRAPSLDVDIDPQDASGLH